MSSLPDVFQFPASRYMYSNTQNSCVLSKFVGMGVYNDREVDR